MISWWKILAALTCILVVDVVRPLHGFVALSGVRRLSGRTTVQRWQQSCCYPLFSRQDDRDPLESKNLVVEIIDRAIDGFTKPATPFSRDLALGFTLVLILQFLFVPSSQALLTVFLFGILRLAGSKIIRLEETSSEDLFGITDAEEEDLVAAMLPIDATALCLSIFSAALLDTSVNTATIFAFGLAFLVTLVLSLGVREVDSNEQLTKDDKLLNQWDERYRKNNHKTD